MSIHIGAKKGEIAETILLPGDPFGRNISPKLIWMTSYNITKFAACTRFTGTYKGKSISVQGSGMGVPSISIYVNELINEYDVKHLIRVGTCGGMG